MGVDRNLYLGPYAECTYKDQMRTVERTGCVNPNCSNHGRTMGGAYCNKCGSTIGKVSVQVPDRPSVYDVTDGAMAQADSTAYRTTGITFAIPNETRVGSPATDIDDAVSVNVLGRDIASEVHWFARSFAGELAKLREAFATVEVKWGFLQWYS